MRKLSCKLVHRQYNQHDSPRRLRDSRPGMIWTTCSCTTTQPTRLTKALTWQSTRHDMNYLLLHQNTTNTTHQGAYVTADQAWYELPAPAPQHNQHDLPRRLRDSRPGMIWTTCSCITTLSLIDASCVSMFKTQLTTLHASSLKTCLRELKTHTDWTEAGERQHGRRWLKKIGQVCIKVLLFLQTVLHAIIYHSDIYCIFDHRHYLTWNRDKYFRQLADYTKL